MGLLSKFEGKMEDTVEGTADKMSGAPLTPVQIAKKAEKQMRREKMVGAGKQYAPTLYTVLVNADDDRRLIGYYPTLAGEIQTYLSAKAAENSLIMDGQPLVRFIVDEDLRHGKFDVIAEMVASPLVEQLRQEEYARYGIRNNQPMGGGAAHPGQIGAPQTMDFADQGAEGYYEEEDTAGRQAYLYDVTNDRAFTLTGKKESIGRESKNSIVIPDINVSREHAEIAQNEAGAWVLTDLRSTNGTFVNGRQIKTIALHDADQIVMGTTNLEFQLI